MNSKYTGTANKNPELHQKKKKKTFFKLHLNLWHPLQQAAVKFQDKVPLLSMLMTHTAH